MDVLNGNPQAFMIKDLEPDTLSALSQDSGRGLSSSSQRPFSVLIPSGGRRPGNYLAGGRSEAGSADLLRPFPSPACPLSIPAGPVRTVLTLRMRIELRNM